MTSTLTMRSRILSGLSLPSIERRISTRTTQRFHRWALIAALAGATGFATAAAATDPTTATHINAKSTGAALKPAVPMGVSVAGQDKAATLNWNASARAQSYNVYQGTRSGGESTSPAASTTSTSVTVNGLANGTQYFFTVRASNAAGLSAASAEVNITPTAPAALPSAPTNLGVTAGNGSVTLNWTASAGATAYNVYQGVSAGAESATAASVTSATTATITGLRNGTTYYFTVAGTNASGVGAASNEVSATPVAPASGPAIRQYAFVQHDNYAANPSNPGSIALTATLPQPTLAGSVLYIVYGSANDSANSGPFRPDPTPTQSDNRPGGGGTYSDLGSVGAGPPAGAQWGHAYSANVSAGITQVTTTWAGFGDYRSVLVFEVVNAATVIANNESLANRSTPGTDHLSSGSMTVASVPALVIGTSTNQSQTGSAPYYPGVGTGYAPYLVLNDYGGGNNLTTAETATINTAGTVAATFTPSGAGSDIYFTFAAAFR